MQSPCARLERIMSPTILPMSKGGPGIRLARQWRRRQTLRRKLCAARPHRRRKALRRQRFTARPLFIRLAWPRRTLRSHDHQRAPRKLSVHAVALCSPCAYYFPHYTAHVAGWTWYATSMALTTAASTATTTMRSPTVFHTCFIRQQRE